MLKKTTVEIIVLPLFTVRVIYYLQFYIEFLAFVTTRCQKVIGKVQTYVNITVNKKRLLDLANI